MLRLAVIFMICFSAVLHVNAQGGGTLLLYENESSFGFIPHTKGFGISFQNAKHRSADKYRLLDFNLYSLKHPKEVKLPNPDVINSRAFVFGKLNSLYVLKANIGARRILADKYTKNSVRLNLNYSAGPILGILKPVFYNVIVPSTENSETISKFKDNTDMQMNTFGTAGFFYGINETTFMFGGNAKSSLSFEWGREDDRFFSIESGVMVDVFPKDVPIFAYIKNNKAFLNLFLTLSYGTRR